MNLADFYSGLQAWKRRLLIIAAVLVGAYFTLFIIDLIIGWSVYGFFLRSMTQYGVSDYIAGIIAVWLTAWIFCSVPSIFLRKRWVWKAALGISTWFAIMFVVTYPYDGLFNPITGVPRFRYSESENVIRKFPMGFNVDPDTGRPLKDFDPPTAERYQKQQKKRESKAGSSGFFPWSSDKKQKTVHTYRYDQYSNSGGNLTLWIDNLELMPAVTNLLIAVKRTDNEESAYLRRGYVTYLVDDDGNRYDLASEYVGYTRYRYKGGLFSRTREEEKRLVQQGEIYRFWMVFPPVKPDTSFIKFFHGQFREWIELDEELESARSREAARNVSPSANPSQEVQLPERSAVTRKNRKGL